MYIKPSYSKIYVKDCHLVNIMQKWLWSSEKSCFRAKISQIKVQITQKPGLSGNALAGKAILYKDT